MPVPITDPKVKTTVEPEFATLETAIVEPLEVTTNVLAAAVVALNASLKVSVKSVPAVLTAAELIVGAVVSFTTVELLVIVCASNEATSFPCKS